MATACTRVRAHERTCVLALVQEPPSTPEGVQEPRGAAGSWEGGASPRSEEEEASRAAGRWGSRSEAGSLSRVGEPGGLWGQSSVGGLRVLLEDREGRRPGP